MGLGHDAGKEVEQGQGRQGDLGRLVGYHTNRREINIVCGFDTNMVVGGKEDIG